MHKTDVHCTETIEVEEEVVEAVVVGSLLILHLHLKTVSLYRSMKLHDGRLSTCLMRRLLLRLLRYDSKTNSKMLQ
jgi:hypothetical protein